MRPAAVSALLTLLCLVPGCSTRTGDLTLVAPGPSPKKFQVVKADVEGQDCATSILLFPVGNTTPTADATIDAALAQAEGADALVDASFYWDQLVTIFYNKNCLRVQGTAVRTK